MQSDQYGVLWRWRTHIIMAPPLPPCPGLSLLSPTGCLYWRPHDACSVPSSQCGRLPEVLAVRKFWIGSAQRIFLSSETRFRCQILLWTDNRIEKKSQERPEINSVYLPKVLPLFGAHPSVNGYVNTLCNCVRHRM